MLMPHSEVVLNVALPGQFVFRVGWFQGMEGFTGWHSGAHPARMLRIPHCPMACSSAREKHF